MWYASCRFSGLGVVDDDLLFTAADNSDVGYEYDLQIPARLPGPSPRKTAAVQLDSKAFMSPFIYRGPRGRVEGRIGTQSIFRTELMFQLFQTRPTRTCLCSLALLIPHSSEAVDALDTN